MLKQFFIVTMAVFAVFSVFSVIVSEVKGETAVKYKSGDEEVSATIELPRGGGPFPAVILIHEWWGLDNWIKENTKRFAENGYLPLAIDLYRGKVADNPAMAAELMNGAPLDRVERDLLSAVAYLRSRKDVNPNRIGAIGWCMGGGYSLSLAMKQADLTSAVMCYGRVATDKTALSKIGASMLGIFGGKDGGIPVNGVRQFEDSLKELGKRVEIYIYDEAGHAFMNQNNKAGYREADTKEAWEKIDAFFKRTLLSSGAVAVEPIGKLAISWGQIKSKSELNELNDINHGFRPKEGLVNVNRSPQGPFLDRNHFR